MKKEKILDFLYSNDLKHKINELNKEIKSPDFFESEENLNIFILILNNMNQELFTNDKYIKEYVLLIRIFSYINDKNLKKILKETNLNTRLIKNLLIYRNISFEDLGGLNSKHLKLLGKYILYVQNPSHNQDFENLVINILQESKSDYIELKLPQHLPDNFFERCFNSVTEINKFRKKSKSIDSYLRKSINLYLVEDTTNMFKLKKFENYNLPFLIKKDSCLSPSEELYYSALKKIGVKLLNLDYYMLKEKTIKYLNEHPETKNFLRNKLIPNISYYQSKFIKSNEYPNLPKVVFTNKDIDTYFTNIPDVEIIFDLFGIDSGLSNKIINRIDSDDEMTTINNVMNGSKKYILLNREAERNIISKIKELDYLSLEPILLNIGNFEYVYKNKLIDSILIKPNISDYEKIKFLKCASEVTDFMIDFKHINGNCMMLDDLDFLKKIKNNIKYSSKESFDGIPIYTQELNIPVDSAKALGMKVLTDIL